MRVIAKQVGFYNGSRVRVGQVFEVPEGTKGKWFEPVPVAEVEAPKVDKPKRKAKGDEPATLGELAKIEHEALTPKGADDLV